MVLTAISLFFLICIALQDFTQRAVYWWLFLCFIVTIITSQVISGSWSGYKALIGNVIFILFILTGSLLYARYKGVRVKDFTGLMLGTGDIVFFFCLAVSMPFVHFIAFFQLSLLVALMSGAALRLKTIPLAGIQASLAIPYFAFPCIQNINFI